MSDPRVHRILTVGEHCCIVADNGLAFYVAYVFIPEGHPWHGLHYDTIEELYEVHAHGGLTFSDERDFNDWDGVGDGCPVGWYVGMDFGHFCDVPIDGSYMADHWPVTDPAIAHHWDDELVSEQVVHLAKSAQAAASVAAR